MRKHAARPRARVSAYAVARMRPVYYLGLFIPAAVALALADASAVVIFGTAALAVILAEGIKVE